MVGTKRKAVDWEDGSGLRIPMSPWVPTSEVDFKQRSDEIMGRWRSNNFEQQGMEANGSETMVAADPRYTIDFDGHKEYDWRGATVTYKLIANAALHGHFQDGSQQREGHTRRLHHSTRDAFLASICREGLKATGQSHEVTGCWFRDCAGSEMFDWGLTPLDFLCGCYITCIADSGQTIQRRRLGGPTRAVVRGPAWSADIAVRCESITFQQKRKSSKIESR